MAQGMQVGPGSGSTGPQAVVSGGNQTGLASVLPTLRNLNDVGKIKIPDIPKVSAQPVESTNVEKVELPSWLNLQGIQQDLMTGLDLERAGQESETKNFLQRTGFADSTLANSEMGRIGREYQAARGGINEKIYGMALGEAQLKQSDRQLQAQLDQQRKQQNVANQIATGTFNVNAGLQATQLDMNSAIAAAGLAVDVIMKDYYIQVQQNQAQQESLQSFLEVALEGTGGGTSDYVKGLGSGKG